VLGRRAERQRIEVGLIGCASVKARMSYAWALPATLEDDNGDTLRLPTAEPLGMGS